MGVCMTYCMYMDVTCKHAHPSWLMPLEQRCSTSEVPSEGMGDDAHSFSAGRPDVTRKTPVKRLRIDWRAFSSMGKYAAELSLLPLFDSSAQYLYCHQ